MRSKSAVVFYLLFAIPRGLSEAIPVDVRSSWSFNQSYQKDSVTYRSVSIGETASAAEILTVLSHPMFSHEAPGNRHEYAKAFRSWLLSRALSSRAIQDPRQLGFLFRDLVISDDTLKVINRELGSALQLLNSQKPTHVEVVRYFLPDLRDERWEDCLRLSRKTACASFSAERGDLSDAGSFLAVLTLKDAHVFLLEFLEKEEKSFREKEASKALSLARQRATQVAEEAAQRIREYDQDAPRRAYDARKKTLLEQVFNYTSFADMSASGLPLWWVSGLNGTHKCVMTLVSSKDSGGEGIDVRRMSRKGFLITHKTVGDEKQKIFRSPQCVLERLQNAWRLAFSECPPTDEGPF